MEQYKEELQAVLRALAEVSLELLEAEADAAEYKELVAERDDLIQKIQDIEDRRRQAYIQNKEEDHA